MLHQTWTPIADARRLIAERYQQVAGSQRGVLSGPGLDCAAATAAFRAHIALCARGESADCALIGAPHLVGDGPGGDGLAVLTVGCVGLARAAAGGSFDRFGALD